MNVSGDGECWSSPVDRREPGGEQEPSDLRLIPLPRLEWSLAAESDPPVEDVTAGSMSPRAIRRGWVHRAAENRVLTLFRKLTASAGRLPAPWWLRALDRGEIASRSAAYDVEDEVHALLTARRGWVFVPWAAAGETGYWEYGPSDRHPVTAPTTVSMTDRHRGWITVVPAHADPNPALPVPVPGITGLAAMLPRIESW